MHEVRHGTSSIHFPSCSAPVVQSYQSPKIKRIWWPVYRDWKCPRDRLGASPGTSGTSWPDLRVMPHRLDRMSRDKRDISAGQTGHVDKMAAIQKWECPVVFLYVSWVFLAPRLVVISDEVVPLEAQMVWERHGHLFVLLLSFLLLQHLRKIFWHNNSRVSLLHSDKNGKTAINLSNLEQVVSGAEKRGHYERGLFTGQISRLSRISRKRSESPFCDWGFSKNSRISKFSRISRKWTFLKRPLFQKTAFSEPDCRGATRAALGEMGSYANGVGRI